MENVPESEKQVLMVLLDEHLKGKHHMVWVLFDVIWTKMWFFFFLSKVPFDEEDKDKDVWFFDHEYFENMHTMFKKVNGNINAEWI